MIKNELFDKDFKIMAFVWYSKTPSTTTMYYLFKKSTFNLY
ncbi:hypothetical protein [Mucilaginibacter sp. L196]|nr:hypothetical protein [Mucilaginibacter sp. L196]